MTTEGLQARVDHWRAIADLDARAGAPVGKALRDACNELDRLRERVEYLTERYGELSDLELGIKRLTTGSGSIEMSLHMAHDMMRVLVAGVVKILDEVGGPNYVEMMFKLAGSNDRYTLTIRRPDGKTPGEVASEERKRADDAEAEVRRLTAENDRLRARRDELTAILNDQDRLTECLRRLREFDAIADADAERDRLGDGGDR